MRGDEKRENWLLIKAKDTEANQGENGDIVDDQSFSIKTGRSMDEIAGGEVPASTKKKRAQLRGDGLKKLLQLYPEVQLATLVDRPPQGAQWQGLDSEVPLSRCLTRTAEGHRCRAGYGSRRRQ